MTDMFNFGGSKNSKAADSDEAVLKTLTAELTEVENSLTRAEEFLDNWQNFDDPEHGYKKYFPEYAGTKKEKTTHEWLEHAQETAEGLQELKKKHQRESGRLAMEKQLIARLGESFFQKKREALDKVFEKFHQDNMKKEKNSNSANSSSANNTGSSKEKKEKQDAKEKEVINLKQMLEKQASRSDAIVDEFKKETTRIKALHSDELDLVTRYAAKKRKLELAAEEAASKQASGAGGSASSGHTKKEEVTKLMYADKKSDFLKQQKGEETKHDKSGSSDLKKQKGGSK